MTTTIVTVIGLILLGVIVLMAFLIRKIGKKNETLKNEAEKFAKLFNEASKAKFDMQVSLAEKRDHLNEMREINSKLLKEVQKTPAVLLPTSSYLKKMRSKHKLSISKVNQGSGVSKRTIRRIEAGENTLYSNFQKLYSFYQRFEETVIRS